MRLADYTDYTLRVLMYCAAHRDRLVTVAELAERHRLSRNHLMKIVTDLARQGLLETTRGRGGGLRLLGDPRAIRVGDVVRAAETDFRMVECFDADADRCTLSASCRLKSLFRTALRAYFDELDRKTLADLVTPPPAVHADTDSAARTGRGDLADQAGGRRRSRRLTAAPVPRTQPR